LRQEQIVELFGRERSVVTKHIRNVFAEGELEEKSNVQNLHIAGSDKPVKFYNLDVIISVGYRVKSLRGTQFRVWANNILKQYLVQGYALNEQKLKAQQEKLADLQQAIALSSQLIHQNDLSPIESQGILAILEKFSHALTVPDNYDHQRLEITGTQKATQAPIRYDVAIAQIQYWRQHFGRMQCAPTAGGIVDACNASLR
jgi:hypothetical protein